jgi:23S rRNA (uridine2552-2'-O)-methyltransferase
MTRWYKEKKREHFYKQAKRVGYRARSAYKLKQIQNKFKILEKGNTVVDLGAAPGGWSQVAKQIIGENGIIVGIDLLPIKPIEGITFLKGDLIQEETIEYLMDFLQAKKADVVLSDMSPDISGNYSIDQARSMYLCQQALKTVGLILKQNGNFLCKVFSGEELQDFIYTLKENFSSVKIYSPPASRKSSSEVYVISKSFKKG